MTVSSLTIVRFGPLAGRTLEFARGVTIVLGNNEAGKTSLQIAARTALFGFDPPAAHRHSFAAPGDTEPLRLGAKIALGEGVLLVDRKLERSPWMRVCREGTERPDWRRGNDAAPGFEHIPGRVFDALYTVSADDLRAMSARPDEELDRILLGDDPSGRSARAMRAAIDAERTALWRRDHRSKKTRVHGIDESLRSAAEEARAARALERDLLVLEAEARDFAKQAGAAHERAARIEHEIEALDLIERIAHHVRAVGSHADVDFDALLALEDHELVAPGPILAELEDAEEDLVEPRARLAQTPVALDASSRVALEHEDAIEEALRGEVERQRIKRRFEDALDAQTPVARGKGRRLVIAALIGALAGALILVIDDTTSTFIIAAAAAVTVLLFERALVGGSASATIAERRIAEAKAALDEQTESLTALAESVGVRTANADAIPGLLARSLERARTEHLAWSRDAQERERARTEAERAERRLREATARFDDVSEALRAAVPGERSIERAFESARTALAAHSEALVAIREIERDPRIVDLRGDRRLDLAREDGVFDGSEARRLSVERDAARLEAQRAQEGRLRAEERLALERPARTASEIDSEVAALRAERDDVLARHDRLALLSAVLEEGERRHRAEHQSAILDEASELVAVLTDGAWNRVECSGDGRELHVGRGPGAATVPLGAPLSRGLREQVHLCLRMAAIEHLDPDATGPPFLLDEAFAHWDEERRARFYRLVRAQEGRRQMIWSTCHRAFAIEAAEALDAPIVRL